ncbi:hypothetical protein ACFDR9_003579 [Janthinobacterium sp. CG_23.3]|uniref:anti-sigma factor family protein n=1 Tax=unclassified Janthinobacterium TaxID=2610881 RepID=UPI00034BB073|nr:hypothetical protein [Janthinobacterium sp. CG3]
MTLSDDILMAFADGELDDASRQAVEAAMRRDPAVAQRVARYKALRAEVFAAFAPILDETPPPRLLRPLRPLRGAKVVQLDAVRATRTARHAAPEPVARVANWSWPEWAALAAALACGLLLGRFVLAEWPSDRLAAAAGADGALVARGELAAALSQQLSGPATADGKVAIGLSFVSNQGVYCRSFVMDGGGRDLAGLACRSGAQWALPVLVQQAGQARQAGAGRGRAEAALAVQQAVEQRIDSAALDAKMERQALRQGWQR